ncbi:MAG: hypothetical protein AAFX50_18960, partial [Acidobacteriota bacterium]
MTGSRFLLVSLLLLSPAAVAADPDASTPAASDPSSDAPEGDPSFEDEITVTGQQQVRGLQDTPESVAVTTGDQLE